MRFLLVGNYGIGNLGDELLREYFLKTFPEMEWVVVTAAPSQSSFVPRLPFGLRSLLSTPWRKTISALRKSDGMVFGGGTLFTDIESLKAPMLWWWHALWARIFRKKIILAFQGIGPFRTKIGAWCARWVVARAELIIVRDTESFRRISSWKKNKCVLSFDPVLSLFAEQNRDTNGKMFVVIPRGNATQEFMNEAIATWEQKKAEWSGVRVVSLESENADETSMCESLAGPMQASVILVRTLQELTDALRDSAFILTQRYHGAIAAMGLSIPFKAIPQQVGDKLDALQGVDKSEALARIKAGERALREAFHL